MLSGSSAGIRTAPLPPDVHCLPAGARGGLSNSGREADIAPLFNPATRAMVQLVHTKVVSAGVRGPSGHRPPQLVAGIMLHRAVARAGSARSRAGLAPAEPLDHRAETSVAWPAQNVPTYSGLGERPSPGNVISQKRTVVCSMSTKRSSPSGLIRYAFAPTS